MIRGLTFLYEFSLSLFLPCVCFHLVLKKISIETDLCLAFPILVLNNYIEINESPSLSVSEELSTGQKSKADWGKKAAGK